MKTPPELTITPPLSIWASPIFTRLVPTWALPLPFPLLPFPLVPVIFFVSDSVLVLQRKSLNVRFGELYFVMGFKINHNKSFKEYEWKRYQARLSWFNSRSFSLHRWSFGIASIGFVSGSIRLWFLINIRSHSRPLR